MLFGRLIVSNIWDLSKYVMHFKPNPYRKYSNAFQFRMPCVPLFHVFGILFFSIFCPFHSYFISIFLQTVTNANDIYRRTSVIVNECANGLDLHENWLSVQVCSHFHRSPCQYTAYTLHTVSHVCILFFFAQWNWIYLPFWYFVHRLW